MNDWVLAGWYFDRYYWPILYKYWPISDMSSYVPSIETQYCVPEETRTLVVELECASYLVPVEVRTFNG